MYCLTNNHSVANYQPLANRSSLCTWLKDLLLHFSCSLLCFPSFALYLLLPLVPLLFSHVKCYISIKLRVLSTVLHTFASLVLNMKPTFGFLLLIYWSFWDSSRFPPNVAAFQYLKLSLQESWRGTLSGVVTGQGNGFKVKKNRFRLDVRKKFFTLKMMRQWLSLLRGAVGAPSLAGWSYGQPGLVRGVPSSKGAWT